MGFGRGQGRMREKVECVGWCFKDKKLEKRGFCEWDLEGVRVG